MSPFINHWCKMISANNLTSPEHSITSLYLHRTGSSTEAAMFFRSIAAFKTVRISGSFGSLELMLRGKCFEHSLES